MNEDYLYQEIEDLEYELDCLAEENERLKQELAHYKKLVNIILYGEKSHE